VKEKLAGTFLVLDGPDGCGKTTQVQLLAEWLGEQGLEVLSLREPGSTAVGEQVRQILLSPEHEAMDTRTELLLYMAARVQLWAERVAPALKAGKCVLLDRWLSSTCAYQGYAGGFGIDNVITVAELCIEKPWPDLTVILDVDLETAAGRLGRTLDRMEAKGDGYHRKVRLGFLELARKLPNFVIVDAGGDIETVQEKIRRLLTEAEL